MEVRVSSSFLNRYIRYMKRKFAFIAAFLAVTSGAMLPSGTLMDAQAATTASSTAGASGSASSSATLQSQINANNAAIAQLNQEIATYQQEIKKAGANKKTLQAAINSLDLRKNRIEAQVALTRRQINTTNLQIQQLAGQISNTQATIAKDQALLGQYLLNLQKDENRPLFMQVLSSNDLTSAWNDMNATLQAQSAVESEMTSLQQQQQALADSKSASQQKQQSLTSQQQTLTTQQENLSQTVQSKSTLLAQTKAKESNYEKLLAAAEAELQSFTAFTKNAGGSGLVGNQTQCDAWGCYYSQRDSAWGRDSLDGTKYTLADAGCLITSMAMVLTHYGYRNVTPVTINSNPANFAAYYPAYLLLTINVDGKSVTRKRATIDATLATGNPVIVGVHAYGGTHYVVLVSGKNGNYIMKDPYVKGGNDIPFSSHYSMRSIFSVRRVVIS